MSSGLVGAGSAWQERLVAGDTTLHIHLIGIGGAGLSAIAAVLLDSGFQVTGSDRRPSSVTQRLEQAGVRCFSQQTGANFDAMAGSSLPDLTLISSAIGIENPERQAAAARGIPIVKRSEFLPILLADRKLIAVAGSHGKTTTTAMIVQVLRANGIDCGYIIGSEVPVHGIGAAGTAAEFVLEADEYDHMFLGLSPQIAVITNVEWDHPDCYPSPASFRRAFMQFTDSVDRDGVVISCADDLGAEQVHTYASTRGPRWITYGFEQGADLQAKHMKAIPGRGTQTELTWWKAPAGHLILTVPGLHNVRNAMAAIVAASTCGIALADAAEALQSYTGSARRFEWKGEADGVTVIDDYAHHPSEIAATLAAARQRYPKRRIWAVFQPHTFSRTRRMLYRMGDSFDAADRVIVLDIYAAREADDGSVSAAELVAASSHSAMQHIPTIAAAARYLAATVEPGDVVITLGAGDGYLVGEQLLDLLDTESARTDRSTL